MNWLNIAIDVALMGGMIATMLFCARLYARLNEFNEGRDEMRQLMMDFGESTAHAEAAVRGLRANADEMGRKLQIQLDDGHALLDELRFITESGESLAERLDRVVDKVKASGVSKIAGEFAAEDEGEQIGAVSEDVVLPHEEIILDMSAVDDVAIDASGGDEWEAAAENFVFNLDKELGSDVDNIGVASQSRAERELMDALGK